VQDRKQLSEDLLKPGNRELREQIFAEAMELIKIRVATDANSYVKIDVGREAGDIQAFFLNLLAAYQRMPKGGGGDGSDTDSSSNNRGDSRDSSRETPKGSRKQTLGEMRNERD